MTVTADQVLITAGALNAAAAVAHLACIIIGAPAYRFMGAGEKMAKQADAGKLRPTLVTLTIAAVLFIWAAYAWSAAGLIVHLPLMKFVLPAICAVLLTRAALFPLLKPFFPGNTQTFWLVSSGVCLVMGLVHVYGVVLIWPRL